jgi:nucleolar protein 56
MIIQSIALLDQMDKDINTFAMRVREWYSWHFPELKDIVKDNFLFAKCASYIKVRSFVEFSVSDALVFSPHSMTAGVHIAHCNRPAHY